MQKIGRERRTVVSALHVNQGGPQISQIEQVAGDLRKAAAEDSELSGLVELTHELLDLCRSTQKVYLDCPDGNEPVVDAVSQCQS